MKSPESALIRSKELVHLLHLGGFQLTKFVSNVADLADRIDGSAQFTEPKVIVSSKEITSKKITTELAFALGKDRVAPLKVMTVPKLELQTTLLAACLKRDICRAVTVTVDNVFMWTDSTIVLQWINSTNKHPIFIANRVSEILMNTSVDQWNHVATCDNPVDAGTRVGQNFDDELPKGTFDRFLAWCVELPRLA